MRVNQKKKKQKEKKEKRKQEKQKTRREQLLCGILLTLAVLFALLMAHVGLQYPSIYSSSIYGYDSMGVGTGSSSNSLSWNPLTISATVTLSILFSFILFIYKLERNLPKKMLFIKIDGERYQYIQHYENERDAQLDANGLTLLGFPVHIIYSQMLNLYLLLRDGGAVK